MQCKICNNPAFPCKTLFAKHKYSTELFRCRTCGFGFLEPVTWLPEAYKDPINQSDTGYVARNLWARDVLQSIITKRLNPNGTFLDYAGGFGLLVRLMRDIGYEFRWIDQYCQNLFCRGFEASHPLTGPYEAVTAFEVLEHLLDPSVEISKLLRITSFLIFSTTLFPAETPAPESWSYYGLEHGQHISFYTRDCLQILAAQHRCHFKTNGLNLHILARDSIPADIFLKRRKTRWQFWLNHAQYRERTPLTQRDHDTIASAQPVQSTPDPADCLK